jgi:hypothetical protein
MKYLFPFFISFIALSSCAQSQKKESNYPLQVGDIYFDARIDDPNFKVCDESQVFQYYNFGKGLNYKGEKIKINEHFKTHFKSDNTITDSGYLTIRFIVNCKGETGRFRLLGMDTEYKEKVFNESLSSQLLQLTKQLDGWIVGEFEGERIPFDYYQYLTFKLENGKLIEIMP